jgi:hypothetical protein
MSEPLPRQMHDYFAYLDEEQGAVDLVTVREPRIGDGPVRTIQLTTPSPKRTRRGWVVAGAASAAVLVLVGGWAWLLTPTASDAPVADTVVPTTSVESTPTTVPAIQSQWPGLTEDIPEGVETGTLTTSLGTARWVHLSSDDFTLPGQGPLEVNADGEFIVSDLPTGFWYSDGGIEWSREPEPSNNDHGIPADGVPTDTDQMTHFFTDNGGDRHILPWVPYADGSYALYWIISSDPMGIWNWEGGRSDYHANLSDLVSPDSDGFTWDKDISRPISRYGNAEGIPVGVQHVLHVTFTGPDQQVDQRLLVLDEVDATRTAAYVEVPWDVSSDVTLFGTSHSVYAYVRDWTTDHISVWRTGDGYAWTDLGPLHVELGAPSSFNFEVTVLPALQDPANEKPIRNQVIVATTPGYGWESTDGVHWTPAPEGFPEGAHLIRLESGWFATDGDVWWMHLGDGWVSLADLGLENSENGCQAIPRASGQTTAFFSRDTCIPDRPQAHPTDLWIISLDS